jgi:hypothetical protein
MAHEAARALDSGCGKITFVVPKGATPRGFPRGELMCEQKRDGRIEYIRQYDPEKVLAWLVKHGLITVVWDGSVVQFRETEV